jgi:hypothetical protein
MGERELFSWAGSMACSPRRLLASDASAFRGWRNESVLDHCAGCLCIVGTDCAKELASIAGVRVRSTLLWRVVSFLSEAGQLMGSQGGRP